MVFLALKLKNHFTLDAPTLENPNILILTDRIDLDEQISKTFVACGLPNPKQAKSVAGLREAVATAGNGQILLSTIFKFANSRTPTYGDPVNLDTATSLAGSDRGQIFVRGLSEP